METKNCKLIVSRREIWHGQKNFILVIEELAKKIGVKFNDLNLLQQAVTHRSYLNEHREYKLAHNERLEFLGDAVLELVVTEYLYNNYPNNPEGEMTNWRAALVNGEMLAIISKEIGVEKYLMMSRGEANDTGRARQYLLANAFEAITGAIYLDQKTKGYNVCRDFILKHLVIKLPNIIEKKLYLDAKSRLQEEAQERVGMTPSYRVLEETGPDHGKKFIVGAYVGEEMVARGEGLSKQEAQRSAAEKALEEKGW